MIWRDIHAICDISRGRSVWSVPGVLGEVRQMTWRIFATSLRKPNVWTERDLNLNPAFLCELDKLGSSLTVNFTKVTPKTLKLYYHFMCFSKCVVSVRFKINMFKATKYTRHQEKMSRRAAWVGGRPHVLPGPPGLRSRVSSPRDTLPALIPHPISAYPPLLSSFVHSRTRQHVVSVAPGRA